MTGEHPFSYTERVTELQRRILAFIQDSMETRGLPPTLREIGAHCAVRSTGSVAYHLRALEREGHLKRRGSVSRGVQPTEPHGKLPVIGRVGAGSQVIAREDVEGYLELPKEVARGANFLLRVRGESMTGEGIIEGDLVQVRRQDSAEDGELVVALTTDGAGLVKRLRRRGGRWTLESAHPEHRPITEGFQVLGKVVGLLRRY